MQRKDSDLSSIPEGGTSTATVESDPKAATAGGELQRKVDELSLEVENLTELLAVEQEQNDAMSNEVEIAFVVHKNNLRHVL